MIKKRGKMRRGLIVMGSAAGSINDLALGMWRSDASRRWLLPLAVFLCITGLLLALAASVEALAPFIYSIF
jgi:ABC-type phosphate transport system permease subunit